VKTFKSFNLLMLAVSILIKLLAFHNRLRKYKTFRYQCHGHYAISA